MRNFQWIIIFASLSSGPAHAQAAAATKCDVAETRIPILFRFQNDSLTQSSWVLNSLRPRLISEERNFFPRTSVVRDGALALQFCVDTKELRDRFTLTVGPRSLSLAARPLTKSTGGNSQMADIALLDQPKPDWIIVRSIERLSRGNSNLPSFDVELFNFGSLHPGGRVKYVAGSHAWACLTHRRGETVKVEVSLSGKRLKVASTDPEFPEESVERSAQIRSGYCGANFDVSIDFGSTGRLAPGPTRIRYAIRSTDVPSKPGRQSFVGVPADMPIPDSAKVNTYFPPEGYQISVEGDGIWAQ